MWKITNHLWHQSLARSVEQKKVWRQAREKMEFRFEMAKKGEGKNKRISNKTRTYFKEKQNNYFSRKKPSGNIMALLLLCDIVTRLSVDFYMGLLFLSGMPFLSIARPIWESNRRNWFWFCCWYTAQRGAKWWGEQRWKEFGTRERAIPIECDFANLSCKKLFCCNKRGTSERNFMLLLDQNTSCQIADTGSFILSWTQI